MTQMCVLLGRFSLSFGSQEVWKQLNRLLWPIHSAFSLLSSPFSSWVHTSLIFMLSPFEYFTAMCVCVCMMIPTAGWKRHWTLREARETSSKIRNLTVLSPIHSKHPVNTYHVPLTVAWKKLPCIKTNSLVTLKMYLISGWLAYASVFILSWVS